ncbi:MAG: hypothetical protein ACTTJI_07615 [Capnocytophaga sp.]|uniref:hypothetical protein n=1 Tax=Capnocytophaga sp. TaxID=44737 RepID=UPI003FA13C33
MANFQTPNFEAMARDIFKSISPKIAQKACAFFLQSCSFIPWVRRVDALRHKILSQSLTLKNSIRIAEQSPERVVISVVDRLNYAGYPQREGALAFTKSLDTLFGNFHGTSGKNYSSMRRFAFVNVDTGTADNLCQVILSAS